MNEDESRKTIADEIKTCPLCGGRVIWFPISNYCGCENCKNTFNRYTVFPDEVKKTSAVGNAAAMREALLFVKQYFDKIDPFNPNTYTFAQIEVDHIQDAISAALVAPARNCDVGTPEEQGERCLAQFEQWRRKGDGKKLITAIMNWAQMPYKAEEGGAE